MSRFMSHFFFSPSQKECQLRNNSCIIYINSLVFRVNYIICILFFKLQKSLKIYEFRIHQWTSGYINRHPNTSTDIWIHKQTSEYIGKRCILEGRDVLEMERMYPRGDFCFFFKWLGILEIIVKKMCIK